MKKLSLLILVILFFAGCSYRTTPQLIQSEKKLSNYKHFEKYGAVFLYNERFIEQTYSNTMNQLNLIQYEILNQKIKILTKEGLQYATLSLPVLGRGDRLTVTLRDSLGQVVAVDNKKLIAQAKETGKVAVPQVEVGSTIEVHLKREYRSPFTHFEVWFNEDIPVLHSKFTFSYHDDYGYNIKEYGSVGSKVVTPNDKYPRVSYRTWEKFNVMPASESKTVSWDNSKVPRIGISISGFKYTTTSKSWAEYAEGYEKVLFKEEFFSSEDQLRGVVDSLSQIYKDKELASEILKFVQSNITLKNKPLGELDLDEILEEKSASIWEMAAVLSKMFQFAALSTEVVVTRPKNSGGFDSSFEAPYQLAVPLVTVEVEGDSYLCFPFMPGARLGEYPIWFNNLEGLYLNGAIDPLPKNVIQKDQAILSQSLDLDDLESPIQWDLTFKGYRGLFYRNYFLSNSKEDNIEKIQEWVGDVDKRNSLSGSFKYNKKSLQENDFNLKFATKNEDFIIERKGQVMVSFGKFFKTYYDHLSEDNEKSIEEVTPDVWSEEMLLKNYQSGDELVFHCSDMDNFFIEVKCTQEEIEGALKLKRVITFKKGLYEPSKFKRIQNFTQDLNKIKESYLVRK